MESGAKRKVPTLFSYIAHHSELSSPLVELWREMSKRISSHMLWFHVRWKVSQNYPS